MTIKDLIYQNLDLLLQAQSKKEEGLHMQAAIKIGAYVAAGVLRSRHKETKEILDEEIKGVYQIVGTFFVEHFPSFTNDDFTALKEDSLDKLQMPTFDQDLQEFIDAIMK